MPKQVVESVNGKLYSEIEKISQFTNSEKAEVTLPRLGIFGAHSVARDRWERITTTLYIPSSAENIWQALTNPNALKFWLADCLGLPNQENQEYVLDFGDGEFFLCCPLEVKPSFCLRHLWRWQGIGPATSVLWQLEPKQEGTIVTVIEEAFNPPRDWGSWHGDGWPGILDQLATYLRTGLESRWPWRRMGPYGVIEFSVPVYESWNRLFSDAGIRAWLFTMKGTFAAEQSMTVLMGDASGPLEMKIHEIVQPGERAPSFLPSVNFSFKRKAWQEEVGGLLWLEPSGCQGSILQVFNYGWENLPPMLQLSERKLVASFWANAFRRANLLCSTSPIPTAMPT